MAAVTGNYAGDITELYYVATPLTTVSETTIEAATTASNRVGNITEPGEVTSEANVIEFNIAGNTFASSVVGQRSPGTYDFTVAADWANALHNTLSILSPNETHSWIVVLNQSADNKTYIHFTGRLANSTITGGVGEVGSINFSIARDGAHTIIHNS